MGCASEIALKAFPVKAIDFVPPCACAVLAKKAGFTDIHAGFEDAAMGPPSRDKVKGMWNQPNKGGYKSWYIASARKPR